MVPGEIMKPIGPLMHEHRLIERMVALLSREMEGIRAGEEVRPDLVASGVDFFRTYADRTHHGKEEDILFRDLETREMPPELWRTMEELRAEHVYGRKVVGELLDARGRHLKGDVGAREDIAEYLATLVEFYPAHIEKEDKHFFFPCMDLFTAEEQEAMLQEFWEFDRRMIHEKYTTLVETWEASGE